MTSITKILGKDFVKLSGNVSTFSKIIFTQCGDIHPFSNHPIFNDTKYVYMKNCDKNFVFYWLRRNIFPNAIKIYLDSHPCEPDVLHRFSKIDKNHFLVGGGYCDPADGVSIILTENYKRYKNRWANELDNVTIASSNSILKEFNSTKN